MTNRTATITAVVSGQVDIPASNLAPGASNPHLVKFSLTAPVGLPAIPSQTIPQTPGVAAVPLMGEAAVPAQYQVVFTGLQSGNVYTGSFTYVDSLGTPLGAIALLTVTIPATVSIDTFTAAGITIVIS